MKSEGLSEENVTVPTTSDYNLYLKLSYFGTKARVEFKWGRLKQDKVTYGHVKIVNIYIVYKINKIF